MVERKMIDSATRVNGILVSNIYLHNETPDAEECTYYVEYYKPKKKVLRFKVNHVRADGIEILMKKIYIKITKEMAK